MYVRRALALTVTVPLLLAGCSDPAEPTPKMPEPTSSSPSPTESETPEAESAEDFIRRWQALGDEMQQTGKVKEFKTISRGCQACDGLIRTVQEIYGDGGSIDFAGSEITMLKQVGDSPPTFHLDMKTPKTIVRDAQGAVEDEYPAGTGKYVVTLAAQGQGWRVAHYARR